MLLTGSDRARLAEELERRLDGLVEVELELALAVDDTPESIRAVELLGELAGLSDRLVVRAVRDPKRAYFPSLVLSGAALGGVRFTGLPTGYEFPTLIDAFIAVSTGSVDLSPESHERIEALDENRHLRVFTTPT